VCASAPLRALYLDSRRHSLYRRARYYQPQGRRKIHGICGQLEGKNLLIVPGWQIAQLWRATHWKKTDWSILILTFRAVAGGAPVDLVHVAIPACHHKGVSKGWPQYYWRPSKKHFSKSAAK